MEWERKGKKGRSWEDEGRYEEETASYSYRNTFDDNINEVYPRHCIIYLWRDPLSQNGLLK